MAPHQRVPKDPGDLREQLTERLRPRGMPIPGPSRASSTTDSMHQPWPAAGLRSRSHVAAGNTLLL